MNIWIVVCAGICIASTIFQIWLLGNSGDDLKDMTKLWEATRDLTNQFLEGLKRDEEFTDMVMESNKRNMDSNDKVIKMLEEMDGKNE